MKHATTDDLIRDLGIVVEDLEALVAATAHDASDKVTAIRQRAQKLVTSVKSRMSDVEQHVAATTRTAIREADTYVREHAWETIAAAAKAGVFVGIALRRDKK